MASTADESQEDEQREQQNVEVPHTGNADTEQFRIHRDELEHAARGSRNFLEKDNVELYESEESDHWVVRWSPDREAVSDSSEENHDFNVLHRIPEVVLDFLREFPKTEEPSQVEGVEDIEDFDGVISQGRNIDDAIAAVFDEPMERVEGKYLSPVIATAEDSDYSSDELVIYPTYGDHQADVVAKVHHTGESSDADIAGAFEIELADNPEEYADNHNELSNAAAKALVGRSEETPPEVRRGEILARLVNEIGPVDWERLEYADFELRGDRSDHENSLIADYDFVVTYDDGEEERYDLAEESLAWPGFEELSSVQRLLGGGEKEPEAALDGGPEEVEVEAVEELEQEEDDESYGTPFAAFLGRLAESTEAYREGDCDRATAKASTAGMEFFKLDNYSR